MHLRRQIRKGALATKHRHASAFRETSDDVHLGCVRHHPARRGGLKPQASNPGCKKPSGNVRPFAEVLSEIRRRK